MRSHALVAIDESQLTLWIELVALRAMVIGCSRRMRLRIDAIGFGGLWVEDANVVRFLIEVNDGVSGVGVIWKMRSIYVRLFIWDSTGRALRQPRVAGDFKMLSAFCEISLEDLQRWKTSGSMIDQFSLCTLIRTQ